MSYKMTSFRHSNASHTKPLSGPDKLFTGLQDVKMFPGPHICLQHKVKKTYNMSDSSKSKERA